VKITRVESFAVEGPVSDLCFAKVHTDEPGLYGWGEGSLPGKCRAVAAAVDELESLLVGMDPMAIERCWQRMYRHSYWRGGSILTSSISAVDIALWDLKGKALGKPVCDLLGGPVRDRIWAYANLGLSTDPSMLRARAQAAIYLGYSAVKFYPLPAVAPLEGPGAYAQVARCCEAVRNEIGADGTFCLDFHGRCSPNVAVQMEAAIRHTRPLWIEEPVPSETVSGLKRCIDQFVTPLATGERMVTRWGFREVLERGLADVLQPDAANAGGISEMMKIAAMCELYGVAFAPHNPNGPVQGAASVHIAASAPAFSILEHRHDCEDAFSAFADPVPTCSPDGWMEVPRSPGLGIDLDADWLRAHPATLWGMESFRPDGSIGDW
jgi:galactonate dehydratase